MIGLDAALTLLSFSVPITVAIMKLVPKREVSSAVASDIAAIQATLQHIQGDITDIRRDIRDLRSRR